MAELVPKSDIRLAVTVAPFAFPRDVDVKAPPSGVLATLRIIRPAPTERETEQVQPLAKVFTPEGKEVGTVRQNAAVTVRPAADDAQFDVLTPIGLRPGRDNVRFSAHSVRPDRTGSAYTDVIVPDFEKDKLSLSGVVLSSVPAPFAAPKNAYAAIIPVVPTTKREFDRSDRATAFVRIYEGGKQPASRVDVVAGVTDANGAQVQSTTDVVTADAFSKSRSADYTCELPLQRLPAGAYL